MAENWSREENEKVVADYFDMWSAHLRGEDVNKAEHWRRLLRVLKVRSKGAIEKKHGNISAILHDLDCPSLPGYQPYHNYQRMLGELVAARLAQREDITALIAKDADRRVALPREFDAMSALIDEPAPARKAQPRRKGGHRPTLLGARVNYLERQARNSALGRDGEELIVRFEQQRLTTAGKESLAARVEHVAVTQGASAGFDVRSFEETGTDRLIEVKTTTWGRETPFYVTANELRVSEKRADHYHLYRVYEFRGGPPSARRMILKGSIAKSCDLRPTVYRATAS